MTEVVKRDLVAEFAHDVLDIIAEDFSRPEYRAGFAVTALTMAALSRMGVRFIPTVIVSFMAGKSAEFLYGTLAEINAKLGGGYVDPDTI